MKKLFLITLFILLSAPAFSAIQEYDPTKVLVDTDTGQVIFIPRDLDYQASIIIEQIRNEYQLSKQSADKVKIPSLFDLIFGRKGGCGK